MGGAYRGATGKLIGIDGTDGIVKLDDTLDVKILDMVILAKQAWSRWSIHIVWPVRVLLIMEKGKGHHNVHFRYLVPKFVEFVLLTSQFLGTS